MFYLNVWTSQKTRNNRPRRQFGVTLPFYSLFFSCTDCDDVFQIAVSSSIRMLRCNFRSRWLCVPMILQLIRQHGNAVDFDQYSDVIMARNLKCPAGI